MSASTAAAHEAAAALHWSWLRGYELQVAAGQEWPGPGETMGGKGGQAGTGCRRAKQQSGVSARAMCVPVCHAHMTLISWGHPFLPPQPTLTPAHTSWPVTPFPHPPPLTTHPSGPREGENDLETYHMVQELAAQGVADVSGLGMSRDTCVHKGALAGTLAGTYHSCLCLPSEAA